MQRTWLLNHSDTVPDLPATAKAMALERGAVCLSIIIPTHRLGSNRSADRRVAEHAVSLAKQGISALDNELSAGLDELFRQIDFGNNKDGVGIFVSSGIKSLVPFPFPVTQKIIIGTCFHLHDILYVVNYSVKYYLLDISEERIRLYSGLLDHLEEVTATKFPQRINPEQARQPGGNGAWLRQALQETDTVVCRLANADESPLILLGTSEHITLYSAISQCREKVIGAITDHHTNLEEEDRAILAWLKLKNHINSQRLALLTGLKQKVITGDAICGATEIRDMINNGTTIRTLLLEKDYYADENANEANRKHGKDGPAEIRFTDIVNEMVSLVLEKNGKIIIMERDELKSYKRIVAIPA